MKWSHQQVVKHISSYQNCVKELRERAGHKVPVKVIDFLLGLVRLSICLFDSVRVEFAPFQDLAEGVGLDCWKRNDLSWLGICCTICICSDTSSLNWYQEADTTSTYLL